MWARPFRTRQCERAREFLSLRLDGELSELEDALVRTHVGRCAECHDFAVSLDGFTGLLRAAPLERPSRPISLPRRAHAALRGVQFAAAAAAVAVVIGVGSMLALLGSPSSPHSHLPQVNGSFRNEDLAELRRLRRSELVFTSTIVSQRANDERILRLS